MRDVLFIYRVLLPPLALLILGCFQLSEERAQVDVHPAANLDSQLLDSGTVLNSRHARPKIIGSLGLGLNGRATSGEDRNMREIFSRSQKNKAGNPTNADVKSRNTAGEQLMHDIFGRIVHLHKQSKHDLVKFNNEIDLIESQLPAIFSGRVPSQHRGVSRPDRHRGRFRRSAEDKPSKRMKLRTPQTMAPEYMIQLYRLLEGTHYNLLMNTVVTSFININEQGPDNEASSSKLEGLGVTSTSTTFVFDVSLPKEEEIIQYAEVRLYLARACDTPDPDACKTFGQINIYELDIESDSPASAMIACKNFSIANGTWESVNVTSAVRSWVTFGLKAFEVNISYEGTDETVTHTNIALDSFGGKDPLLVVFSKKSGHVDGTQHRVEKRDTVSSIESLESSLFQQTSTNQNNYSRHYFQGLLNAVTTMERDAQVSAHYLPVVEDAQLILSIENEKAGNNNGVRNNTFQSKVSNSFLQSKRPLKRGTLQNMPSTSSTEVSAIRHFVKNSRPGYESSSDESSPDLVLVSRVRRQAKARFRRHLDVLFNDKHVEVAHSRFKRSKKKRNSCRRKELYIEFKDIKWDKAIIFPDGYQAFECIGRCYFPIGAHLSPTKHAIIQTLLHTSYPDRASRACCVPTKLEPISILYYDNISNKSTRYDYTYEGMIAAECGCR